MKVIINTSPPAFIRASQCGDWEYTTETLLAFVTQECKSPESQLAVGIHEVIEAFLCRRKGITDKAVCKFDEMYEKEREEGLHSRFDEPGDDPRAPYREEHMAATHVERAVCAALGLTWEQHENAVLE